MSNIDTTTDDTLGMAVRDLRDKLLLQGFQHGRRPGELVGMADNGVELHVRTGYTHGSYRVLAFGRRNGEKQGLVFIDLNRGSDPKQIVDLTRALCDWNGQIWPPDKDMHPAVTGQGDGGPQK